MERRLLEQDLCIYRCLKRPKVDEESIKPSLKPSPGLQKYLTCAEDCSYLSEAIEIGPHALERLRKCGVVHLKNVYSPEIIRELETGWERLISGEGNYNGGFHIRELESIDHLRGQRTEVFLPYVPPFNKPEFLMNEQVMELTRSYFGDDGGRSKRRRVGEKEEETTEDVIVDYTTVIRSRGGGESQDQVLHTDVDEATHLNTTLIKRERALRSSDDRHGNTRGNFVIPFSQHLEMHVMLQEVTLDMGPTLFCPCTHGHYWGGEVTLRTVYKRFGLNGLCEEQDMKTSYKGISPRKGDITIYGNPFKR